jgi:hypothetical protein
MFCYNTVPGYIYNKKEIMSKEMREQMNKMKNLLKENRNIENGIPTASELTDKRYKNFDELDTGDIWSNIEDLMIEFAKLHVEAALKEASSQAHWDGSDGVNIKSILNSYPLTNIR